MPRDETRCIAKVPDDTGWHSYQCQRKRGHGPDGKYCWQHAKRFEPKPIPEVPLREKLRKDLQPFVEAMLDELVRHHPEKGESYKLGAYYVDLNTRYSSMPSIDSKVLMRDNLLGLLEATGKRIKENPWSNQGEFVDQALFDFMIWWQLENKPKTYASNWGFQENQDWIWESLDDEKEKTQ